jgi:hypothetical protein
MCACSLQKNSRLELQVIQSQHVRGIVVVYNTSSALDCPTVQEPQLLQHLCTIYTLV